MNRYLIFLFYKHEEVVVIKFQNKDTFFHPYFILFIYLFRDLFFWLRDFFLDEMDSNVTENIYDETDTLLLRVRGHIRRENGPS